jgi:L-iditol 2-dehydrogenase
MLALKAAGVERVYVADIVKNRLDKALELGATATIDATGSGGTSATRSDAAADDADGGATNATNGEPADDTATDPVRKLLELTGGKGCDLAIETSGANAAAALAIQAAKKAATVVFVGYSADGMVTLPMGAALDKELTFKTVFRYRHVYPAAIEAVASGKINLKGIVTHTFGFDELQVALDRSASERGAIVKAVVEIR